MDYPSHKQQAQHPSTNGDPAPEPLSPLAERLGAYLLVALLVLSVVVIGVVIYTFTALVG